MKHKKIAVLNINSLEGEAFKNFLQDHPFENIDVFYFQDKETILTSSQNGASLILEEREENLIDFPLVIDFKKNRKKFYEIDGVILSLHFDKKSKLIFYGINQSALHNNKFLGIPHPLNCLFLRIFEKFLKNPPKAIFCNTVLSTSEEGKEGQDELYNQTIALLNFSNIDKKIYKGQVAFNMSLISDLSFQNRIKNEMYFFFKDIFPLNMQFVKSGIFYGSLSFINIIFSDEREKNDFNEWLLEKEDFVFSLKDEGIVEAVQNAKVFTKLGDDKDKKILNLMVFADHLYSGLSYNLYNLTKEFFKTNNMLK